MGYTAAYAKDTLDRNHPTTGGSDHVGYSTNGTSETGIMARTAVGATGWAAATSATPAVKANSAALTSAAASGAGTITHYAIFSAATAGTQKTAWEPATSSKTVGPGDTVQWAVGDLRVTLT